MPSEKPVADDLPPGDDLNWPEGKPFTFHDDGGHNPCYVVMPDGAAIPLNHWNNQDTDIARAKWIIDACNEKWLSTPPVSEPIPEVEDLVERLRDLGVRSADRAAALLSAQAVMLEEAKGTIERLHRNFNLLLLGAPVRDVAETEAEVKSTLAKMEAQSHVG